MGVDKKIDKLANKLGIEGQKTILKLKNGEDVNQKILELQSGDFEEAKPWFIVDENENIYPLIPMELLFKILNATKSAVQENLNIKLEKAIMQEFPIDYNDVFTVAMNEVESAIASPKEKSVLSLNVDGIVKKIKKKHPNLFYNINMNELMSKDEL